MDIIKRVKRLESSATSKPTYTVYFTDGTSTVVHNDGDLIPLVKRNIDTIDGKPTTGSGKIFELVKGLI